MHNTDDTNIAQVENLTESEKSKLLKLINLFELKTLFGFSLNNKKPEVFLLNNKTYLLKVSPFIYLGENESPARIKSIINYFEGHYVILRNDYPLVTTELIELELNIQNRNQFKSFKYDSDYLKQITENQKDEIELSSPTREDYNSVIKDEQLKFHFTNYSSFEEFNKFGLASVAKINDQIVSICSSFCHYNNE